MVNRTPGSGRHTFRPLLFPLSTSKVYAGMKHKTNDLNLTYDMYMNVHKKCNMI